jgi:hypothetical protein
LSKVLRLAPWLVAVWAALPAIPAVAQGNIDAGKSPAQIFTDTCGACHRSPRELRRASAGFLRSHYTTSADEAGAMANYLAGVGSSDPRSAAQPKQPPRQQPAETPATPATAAKQPPRQPAEPKSEARSEQKSEPKSAAQPKGRPGTTAQARQQQAPPAAVVEERPPDPPPAPATPPAPTTPPAPVLEPFEE